MSFGDMIHFKKLLHTETGIVELRIKFGDFIAAKKLSSNRRFTLDAAFGAAAPFEMCFIFGGYEKKQKKHEKQKK